MDYDVDAINESQMVEKSYSKARQKEIEMKLWLLRSSLGHTLVLAMLASYLLKILLHSEFLEIKRLEQKIYLLPEVAKRKKEGLERCSSSSILLENKGYSSSTILGRGILLFLHKHYMLSPSVFLGKKWGSQTSFF